jgi:hypothetical protein
MLTSLTCSKYFVSAALNALTSMLTINDVQRVHFQESYNKLFQVQEMICLSSKWFDQEKFSTFKLA